MQALDSEQDVPVHLQNSTSKANNIKIMYLKLLWLKLIKILELANSESITYVSPGFARKTLIW